MNMNRRRFCQSAAATGFASLLPSHLLIAQQSAGSKAMPSRLAAKTLGGGTTSLEGAAVRELAGSLQGPLLLKGDFGYDGARMVWNGMHLSLIHI